MKTHRARLRRIQVSDFDNMRLLDSDPDVMRFTPSKIPQTEDQTRERIRNQMEGQAKYEPFGIWLAEEAESKSFIGWFMLLPDQDGSLELGFMIVKSSWGKGYATEIGQVLIAYAKQSGIKRIAARTNTDNFTSMRVLEKLGFKYSKNIKAVDRLSSREIELKFYELITN